MISSRLFLETGESFPGYSPDWQDGLIFGEVVFNTGMVGYVETLTDPSYTGQIITFTYPLIGNYGVPARSTWESGKIQVAGVIVSEAAPFHSHRNSQNSFLSWCEQERIPLLCGVDTRALAKTLSQRGVISGAISTSTRPPEHFIDINQQHLVKQVSIKSPEIKQGGDKLVIVVDCGIKQNMLRYLEQFPISIKRVPFDYDYTKEPYDAVFISNGPGDPAVCKETIAILSKVLQADKPVFGICLGSQLMALAIGAKTYKLPFGHRAQNHPCINELTGKCVLTSQNHGFAIDESTLPEGWQVMFRNLNDNTVQGIRHCSKPFFSVQFHPEAAPGPIDTEYLFADFIKLVTNVDEAHIPL